MKYLYSNLSPDDFEALCQDVISTETGSRFERFKPGKDGGIDLRLLEAENQTKIVQVKHSPGSYGSASKALLQKEFNKASSRFGKGVRYLLMTSLGLSIANKNEIVAISKGLIISEKDIVGITEIEDIIDKNQDIVKRHYKLWISSAHVLEALLNSGVYGKSEDYLNRINEKAKLFVQTTIVQKSQEILKYKHVLLITGEPGIGKTTLAEILSLGYVGDGYEFIYVDSVKEAERVLIKDKKQLFLIDDFLGSNYLEFIEGKSESIIIRFIDRIKSNGDKRLILCSRTTIYNNAVFRGIHFNNESLGNIDCIIEMSSYTYLDRAKVLYNHLRYRGLDDSYMNSVKNEREYMNIVKHKNFNPRVIEFITTLERIKDIHIDEYIKFVNAYLDDPGSIWKQAYRNQIDNESKILLQTIYTFGGNVSEKELKNAYINRLKFEVEHSGARLSDSPYNNSLKLLLGGFISRAITKNISGEMVVTVKFINPSVSDFLKIYFKNNDIPLTNTAKSIAYIEQMINLVSAGLICDGKIGSVEIINVFYDSYKYNTYTTENKFAALLKLISVSQLFDDLNIVANLIQGATSNKISHYEFSTIVSMIEIFCESPVDKIDKFFNNKMDIIKILMRECISIYDLESVIDVCKIFGVNILPMISDEFQGELDFILNSEAEELILDDIEMQSCFDPSGVRFQLNRLQESLFERLGELGIEYDSDIGALSNADEHEISDQNMRNAYESNDYVSLSSESFISDHDIDVVFID